jgi:hypothetical protein
MLNNKIDASDALFLHPDLTVEDRDLAKNMFLVNQSTHYKTRSSDYMGEIEDNDFIKNIDYAIKSVLQHNINKRLKAGV